MIFFAGKVLQCTTAGRGSRGGGGNQENSFPQGVNIMPDGVKQHSQGVFETNIFTFLRFQMGKIVKYRGPLQENIKCNNLLALLRKDHERSFVVVSSKEVVNEQDV